MVLLHQKQDTVRAHSKKSRKKDDFYLTIPNKCSIFAVPVRGRRDKLLNLLVYIRSPVSAEYTARQGFFRQGRRFSEELGTARRGDMRNLEAAMQHRNCRVPWQIWKVEIPLQGGLKTAAGSTEPMSARHGNCLSDKKEKCELSAEAASFVLIHTIFKPLLHCDRCAIPTTRAYREYSTTPSKLNPNSRETTHATSGKNVSIKQKK